MDSPSKKLALFILEDLRLLIDATLPDQLQEVFHGAMEKWVDLYKQRPGSSPTASINASSKVPDPALQPPGSGPYISIDEIQTDITCDGRHINGFIRKGWLIPSTPGFYDRTSYIEHREAMIAHMANIRNPRNKLGQGGLPLISKDTTNDP